MNKKQILTEIKILKNKVKEYQDIIKKHRKEVIVYKKAIIKIQKRISYFKSLLRKKTNANR